MFPEPHRLAFAPRPSHEAQCAQFQGKKTEAQRERGKGWSRGGPKAKVPQGLPWVLPCLGPQLPGQAGSLPLPEGQTEAPQDADPEVQ